MSILTIEEKMMLRSLNCRNQAEALTVLTAFSADLQTEGILHSSIQTLISKLVHETIDYATEIRQADMLGLE